MIAPADALAGAEGLHRLVLVGPHRRRNVPGIRHEDRAVLVGQHEGLLRRQLIGVADRVIGDIAAGDLRVEPFAHIAFGAVGTRRQFARADRAGAGHRLVEAEPVAEAHHHAAVTGREVCDRAARPMRRAWRNRLRVGCAFMFTSPVRAFRGRMIAASRRGERQSGTVQNRAVCATHTSRSCAA